jgi:polyhydroxybutyrate depolymerase
MRRLSLCLGALLALACSESATTPDQPQAQAGQGGSPPNAGGSQNQAGTPATSSGDAAAGTTQGGTTTGGAQAGSAGAGGAPGSGSGSGGSAGTTATDPDVPDPSAGCDVTDAFAEGDHAIKVGDLERSYILRKPAGYDPSTKKAWPLVLALHPNGSKQDYWDPTTGERALRPLLKDKAILVMPQARNDDWRGDLPLDLAYFDNLLNELQAKLCIDQRRLFSMGHSGGGSFSGVLGCYRTDIRAIAASGAVIYFEPAECIGKPAAWITVGEEEATPERTAYVEYFRTSAACATTSTAVEPEPCVAYDCPSAERPVVFCAHAGGHFWPPFGTAATVDFFSQFF